VFLKLLLFVSSADALRCEQVKPTGRLCGDKVIGGTASGATVDEARKAATSWWSSRAGALGRGYEEWERAADKKIVCEGATGGSVACTASARPCLPEGVVPDDGKRLEL